jgi:dTDP-4-dehydrorhamnose reductase
VRAAHPGALLVRASLMYGGSEPSRQENMACQAAQGRGGMTFFDELRSPVLVGDLAAALMELADREEAGILHVAGADTVSRYEFAVLLAGTWAVRRADPQEPRRRVGAGPARQLRVRLEPRAGGPPRPTERRPRVRGRGPVGRPRRIDRKWTNGCGG